MVKRLLQGLGDSSPRRMSFVPHCEFNAYWKDHKKQKLQLDNLEKACTGLANSHGELSLSYSKMKKHEKSRDNFITRMWKGFKGLWKLLKANEPLQTLRPDEIRDAPTLLIDDEGAEYNNTTKREKD
ncbi:hypothetical protein KY290_007760 [Solanum tuberosum]|uniref:Uncharacterized protein n=1 Tax=Solanum tuberosum TaxID=4113 RepID=A0ABQ7W6M0_SOLTU|nr:hypothetical protein KY290_007760 [Solanum tuberosum]